MPTTPDPADVASPAAIVRAIYRLLSGPASQPRPWELMRQFYAPGARTMPCGRDATGDTELSVFSFDEYVRSRTPLLALADFYEVEVSSRVEQFGCVAAVTSWYESRRTPTGPAFARGVNIVQCVFMHGRWWQTSIMWDMAFAAGLPAIDGTNPDPGGIGKQ
jgi:hypothetical protein